MSMRTCLTMFVVVVSAGCPWPPRADGSTLALQRSCPDPPNCTVGNGTGVYTEEQGTAAIGPSKLLITHFFNVTGGGVRFMGRYRFTPSVGSPTWQMLSEPGQVRQATYAGLAGLDVLSVREQGTQPTWVLRSPAGGPIEVTGDQLRGLSLEISFATPNDGQRSYELDFAGALSPHVADLSAQATLRPVALAMRWRVPGGAPEDYCFRAPAGGAATPDAVVFLGGIDVDLSAVLSPDAPYEIRRAQDYLAGPIEGGDYQGGAVSFPMTHTEVAQPIAVTNPATRPQTIEAASESRTRPRKTVKAIR